MSRNAWLTILATLLFTAGASWFYLCKIKMVCTDPPPESGASLETTIDQSIAFQRDEAEPMKGRAFEELKAQLLAGLGAGNSLQIIGLYDEAEVNNSSNENLGMARAEAVMSLFPELVSSQVELTAELSELPLDEDHFPASRLNIVVSHDTPEYIEQTADSLL